MTKTKILYVEDELALANIVKDTLEGQGYQIQLISDGAKVIPARQNFNPDLCLLDVMLPNIDGFTIAKKMNQEQPEIPIIFLTAKNQTSDVLEGFKSGGNDYLKKPFSLEELIIRIENLISLKKGTKTISNYDAPILIGRYKFFPNKLILSINDNDRTLTHREAEIIQFFAQHINGVINKKELLLKIWGDDTLYNTRNLDVYINKLRDYLSEDQTIKILTLRGLGYRFNVGN